MNTGSAADLLRQAANLLDGLEYHPIGVALDQYLRAIEAIEILRTQAAVEINDRSIDIDPQNDALILAAGRGNVRAVIDLVKAGADPNFRDQYYGLTPLMYAALYGRAEVAKLLLEQGADINMQSAGGDTAIIIAARNQKHDVLRMIVSKPAMQFALRVAHEKGYLDVMQTLNSMGSIQ